MAGQVFGDSAGVTEVARAHTQATASVVGTAPVTETGSSSTAAETREVPVVPAAPADLAALVGAAPTGLAAPTGVTAPTGLAAPTGVTERAGVRGLGFWALVGRHRPFSAVLTVGVLLRIIAAIGYQPAMWFNDSFDYLDAALKLYPHPLRPDGYSFLLVLLQPFHSFALVVAVQHGMGVAMGLMIYALLRQRFRLPGWGAALAAAPVLLDAYQIQLEQLILSDVMFAFLVIGAITLLMWHAQPSLRISAAVGLIVGIAALTRSVGLPVLAAVVLYMLIRRMRWKVIAAAVLLCALPIGAYSTWYYSVHGKFTSTGTSGIFLYARVSAFANCHKIQNLPTNEIPLCTEDLPKYSQDAIWARKSPLLRNSTNKFSDYQNQLTSDFSKRVILAQPGDYLKVMAIDFFRAFQWRRTVFPDRGTYNLYEFRTRSNSLPNWAMPRGGTAAGDAYQYEQGNAQTKIVEPFAWIMRVYQRQGFVRGTVLGVIWLAGLAGMVPFWRRFGGRAVLPWITATGLLLAPAATAEFDYRYVLPIVPIACIAAGLAFTAEARTGFGSVIRAVVRRRHRGGDASHPTVPASPEHAASA